jgi:cell wall-associated NlpC family hydrolase
MTRGEKLAEAARLCKGTRFHKNGRDAKRGLDCAGLVICALSGIGVECPDADYQLNQFHDHFELMTGMLAQVFDQVDEPLQCGDVLALRGQGSPNHMAVYIGNTVIVHAVPGVGVVETAMDYSVTAQIQSVWRLR